MDKQIKLSEIRADEAVCCPPGCDMTEVVRLLRKNHSWWFLIFWGSYNPPPFFFWTKTQPGEQEQCILIFVCLLEQ